MASAEHQTTNEVRKRDVGCGWDRPTFGHGIVGVRTEECCEAEVNSHRTKHAASGRDQRSCRFFTTQRPVFEDNRFPDFLCRDGKEQRHKDVIDQIVERQRACDMAVAVIMQVTDEEVIDQNIIDKMVIAFGVRVRPCESGKRPDD